MKKEFDLNHQWQLYLQRVAMKEKDMHAVQLQETKRAFFGACGQMIVLLRDEVAALPESEAVEVMKSLFQQVMNFWLQQTNKQS